MLKLPDETAKAIVNDYKAGMKTKDIRTKYSVQDYAIYSSLARFGNNARRLKSQHIPDEDETRAIIQDYTDGVPILKIYKKHDISPSIFYRLLGDNDIPFRNKALSEYDQELITEDLKNGMTRAEICEKYRITNNNFNKYFKGKLHRSNKKTNLTDEKKAELITDYQAGMSLKKMTEKYCLYPAVIYGILNKNNIPLRGRNKSHPHKKYKLSTREVLKILDEYMAGVTVRKICDDHSIPPYVLYNELGQNNLTPQRHNSFRS